MLKTYYRLAKPGIIYGNVMTTIASFLFADKWHIHWSLLLATVFGTGLIIGSACVFNNIIDRPLDVKMARTKKRAMVTGAVKVPVAITYGVILGIVGFSLLAIYVNWLTVFVGLIGIFFYVVVYGYAKRKSIHGTLVGGISGSMPLVAGYTAVTDRLDHTAVLLFVILAAWQMPHFYSIGIYRLKDYTAAGLPIWPVKRGIDSTKRWIIVYTFIFVFAAALLSVVAHAGIIYRVVVILSGLYWLFLGFKGVAESIDNAKWARQMFGVSLIILLIFSAALATGSRLP